MNQLTSIKNNGIPSFSRFFFFFPFPVPYTFFRLRLGCPELQGCCSVGLRKLEILKASTCLLLNFRTRMYLEVIKAFQILQLSASQALSVSLQLSKFTWLVLVIQSRVEARSISFRPRHWITNARCSRVLFPQTLVTSNIWDSDYSVNLNPRGKRCGSEPQLSCKRCELKMRDQALFSDTSNFGEYIFL